MNRLELKIPPPIVALLIGAAMWLLARYFPSLRFDRTWGLALAPVLAGAGLALALVAMFGFVKAKTTIHPDKPQKTSALVTGGIYRFTRNPMYLGVLLVLAGWAIWLSNAAPLALLPLFVLYINRFQIGPEERILSSKFGTAYDDYRQRVRRWL